MDLYICLMKHKQKIILNPLLASKTSMVGVLHYKHAADIF